MSFRVGAYATVWEATPKSDKVTVLRISTSKKGKESGEYITDFSGFVSFVGNSAASEAAKLCPRDRIKLGDVEVTTKYDKSKGVTYTNYACFSFEAANSGNAGGSNSNTMPSSDDFLQVPEGNEEEGMPW